MRVADLVIMIKRLLKQRMRLQAVQLLHTDLWILTEVTSAFLLPSFKSKASTSPFQKPH